MVEVLFYAFFEREIGEVFVVVILFENETLDSERTSIIRRVMVVLPEPVPPQMPMIKVLVEGGIFLFGENRAEMQRRRQHPSVNREGPYGGPSPTTTRLWRLWRLWVFVDAPTSLVFL